MLSLRYSSTRYPQSTFNDILTSLEEKPNQ